ncbi:MULTISPECIES: glycosyltransferase family 2 protein [unclassified Microbacterium]|uniref:glycosyltransferase family 2 protein n=1 Tax=unclassified Microbacterium TaxID=2609290 RepID=UPI0004452F19|nr:MULTISPECIES: glycosyltransferase family 2 protein [unclassified Microbacterium]EXJ53239.1 hypothetical protein AS96_00405 [Microbacterium sp. MRS-1]ODT23773.1 MAG: glycosyltransferase [Microbacterium sp. SCN 69-37]
MDASRPLGLVVVNYGSAHLLAENLVASADRARADVVVVVDNPTGPDERQRVRELARRHEWRVVEPDRNLGFGGGVNAGVEAALSAGVQDLVVLNPDAILLPGCVERLRAADPTHDAVCAPRIVTSAGATWFEGADLYLDDGVTRGRAKRERFAGARRWEWLTGACLWIPVEVWRATGGFDEEYFLYWEDVDFSRRVVGAGARLAVASDAVAVHDEGGTQGRAAGAAAKSENYYFYNIRNRMLFARKHLPAEDARAWGDSIWASAREVLLRGGRKQFLFSAAPWRGGIRGVRSALRLRDRGRGGGRADVDARRSGH